MNVNELIDKFVEKEKNITASKKLNDRILNQLERKPVHSIKLWQSLAVAASISIVIFSGIKLGGLYSHSHDLTSVNINDSEIENLNFYNSTSYE